LKGLVLAGGAGTRLRPLTCTRAKQLVPIANRPILFYVLDTLAAAGIREIGIILSPETGAEVRAAVGDGSAWGARTHFIVQSRPDGLAHAVKIAREFLGDSDFCMYLGDNLIGAPIGAAVASFRASPELSASVMLKEVRDPSRFGVAVLDAEGNVVRLVEKPEDPPSNLALVGIYLLRPSIFAAIDETEPSARGELEITDALCKLLDRGGRVRFERLTSWWLDVGEKDSVLRANDTVLDAWLQHDVRGEVSADSHLTGRIKIEEGAVIVRSSIRGPAIIGKGARIVDAQIGPFSSIGAGVVIERSAVARSVILEDSHVLDTGRLEDSLIGRSVLVDSAASGAKDAEDAEDAKHAKHAKRDGAVSLFVGDHCRIELARKA